MPVLPTRRREQVKLECSPGQKQEEFYSCVCKFLMLMVYATGAAAWYFICSHRKKRWKIRIADFSGMHFQQAMEIALRRYQMVVQGKDPRIEVERQGLTFGDAFERLFIPHRQETIDSWRSDQSKYANYLRGAFGHRLVADIRRVDVEQYLLGLALAVATVNKHLNLLKAFFRFLIERELLDSSPAAGIKAQKENNVVTPSIELDQRERVIRAAYADPYIDAAMALLFMFFTGCRVGEALALLLEDIELPSRTALLRDTKSGDDRVLYLNEEALPLLEKQIQRHGSRGYAFPATDGISQMCRPGRVFKRIFAAAGLPVNFRGHDARHLFAQQALKNGASLGQIGALLGHRDLRSTTRYARWASPELHQAAALAMPPARPQSHHQEDQS